MQHPEPLSHRTHGIKKRAKTSLHKSKMSQMMTALTESVYHCKKIRTQLTKSQITFSERN
jgi:hypothetical protein